MIKINNEMYIIYNFDKMLIILKDINVNEQKSSVMIYENKKNLSNQQIEKIVNKKPSLKDKIVLAYNKSLFDRALSDDIVLIGERFKPLECNKDNECKFKDVYETTKNSLIDGGLILDGGYSYNLHNFKYSQQDLFELIENFRKLEDKHRKDKQEVVEEELGN